MIKIGGVHVVKKKILFGLIAILILLVAGIDTFFVSKNKDKTDVSDSTYITSFEYSFGSFFAGYYEYEIYQDGNQYIFIGKGSNGVDLDIKETIDRDILDEIQEIIQKYDVKKWNGFNKRNRDVLDGHSFSLLVRYDDHKIRANGYMKYPIYYDDFQKEIQDCFDSLVSNLKKG